MPLRSHQYDSNVYIVKILYDDVVVDIEIVAAVNIDLDLDIDIDIDLDSNLLSERQ